LINIVRQGIMRYICERNSSLKHDQQKKYTG
jgi:hypothetical protein